MDDEHHGLGARMQVQLLRGEQREGSGAHPAWPPGEHHPSTPSTHNLAFSAPEVQEQETGTIIRGHLQLLKGLTQQHSSGRTWLRRPQCEAVVDVHRETAGTAIPRAGCGEGVGTETAASQRPRALPPVPTGSSKSGA